MVWESLQKSLGSKPRVLAGPILRRVTHASVTVWLALSEPCDVTLKVLDANGDSVIEGTQRAVAVGANLYIVAVTARAMPRGQRLTEGVVYQYNLLFDFPDHLSANLASATNGANLSYPPYALPSFALPPQDLNFLRVLQGSCRLPHAEGKDAMPLIHDLIQATAGNPYARPHQLLLTGDQIYADDVSDALLLVLSDAAHTLLGWSETLPVPPRLIDPATKLPMPALRYDLLRQAGFRSVDLQSHLMSLGEYLCMYLFVWSNVLWPAALPTASEVAARIYPADSNGSLYLLDAEQDTKSVAEFATTVGKVRRALANVPTYMIFDDHDVTDDWNATLDVCRSMYSKPLGLRVMQNALTAYALCQHWGNAPEQFEKATPTPPGRALLEKLDPGLIAPSQSIPLEQRAARYEQDSQAIRALVGMPENKGEIEQQKAVFHKPGSLQYHYYIECDKHLIIVTDTRTWRSFPKGGDEPGVFLPPAQLSNQILSTPLLGDRALLVVLTTNAPPVQPIRSASRHPGVARTGAKYTKSDVEPDIYEAWDLPSVAFDRLLVTLTSKLPEVDLVRNGQTIKERKGQVILLSGDVHHSFATRLIYRADQRFEDQQPATAVVAQLVASSFKKEDEDTRGFQRDGYRYSPLAARLADFIPNHRPEGYVGWNVPPGTDLSGYGRESFHHQRGVDSMKLQSKGPTVPLWSESQMGYGINITTRPHYRYRLDYLTPIGQDVENLPAAPQIPGQLPGSTPAQRKQAAEVYKVANSHYRLHNRTPGKEKIVGVNNFGEVTFDWGQSYKAVIHTLRWHAKAGSVWTTYRVSLNPNDDNFRDIKDGTN
ncbi:MAG: hypothetical protein ABW250_23745 [Pyrinomonadaceae bacterium]